MRLTRLFRSNLDFGGGVILLLLVCEVALVFAASTMGTFYRRPYIDSGKLPLIRLLFTDRSYLSDIARVLLIATLTVSAGLLPVFRGCRMAFMLMGPGLTIASLLVPVHVWFTYRIELLGLPLPNPLCAIVSIFVLKSKCPGGGCTGLFEHPVALAAKTSATSHTRRSRITPPPKSRLLRNSRVSRTTDRRCRKPKR